MNDTFPSNRYVPIEGGWSIRINGTGPTKPFDRAEIGTPVTDPRRHRRPLYPPAEKAMIWNSDQLPLLRRIAFRPLVLAHNEPRFLFDMHSAGGLAGHLHIGLVDGAHGKWLHHFSDLTVSYVDGHMTYEARDPVFPGTAVKLNVLPLATAVGAVLRVALDGAAPGSNLVWAYGGATAFCTNYELNAPQFSFSPNDCAKDAIRLGPAGFSLLREFDAADTYTREYPETAGQAVPAKKLTITGGASWKAQQGFGLPVHFPDSPACLLASTEWTHADALRTNRVAVQRIPLPTGDGTCHIAVGAGFGMERVLADLPAAYEAAVVRCRSTARRVVTNTPDPYLDAAVTMMSFATEGTWGDSCILHGGWTWRLGFLGWRSWYGATCYGWFERVCDSIRNHTTLGRICSGDDAGALGHMLEDRPPTLWYNMNEVFLDQVRQYFDYTNDLTLMRDIYPVLQGILAWENRRLCPGEGSLYENCLNTWVSDSHWYIRAECTQASAYMLRAHEFMADLASRLGYDAKSYAAQADRIRTAMQDRLWQEDAGVFAEFLDTRGHRMLHPEPELPTVYHSAEFGAATPAQVSRMLRWVDANLQTEHTPGGGRLVWTSNWFPNRGRSYTHTTRELAAEENLNLAIPYWVAGRPDDAYALVRGVMCGIFNGSTPGGLSCHIDVEGRQRFNDEFADASSMFGRAVCEGLFGILPRIPDGTMHVCPSFPHDWSEASIRTPYFSYRWQRSREGDEHECIRIDWEAPQDVAVDLRLPVSASDVTAVRVDTQDAAFHLEEGFDGINWVCAYAPRGRDGTFEIRYDHRHIAPASWPNPKSQSPPVPIWKAPARTAVSARDGSPWKLIDISRSYNASLTEVPQRIMEGAIPPAAPASVNGHKYWLDHVGQRYHGKQMPGPSDAAWRAKVGLDNVAWTTEGIPFKSVRDGDNIAVVTLAGAGFPEAIQFPVGERGSALYLMVSGITFPMQSHVVNLRVTLAYVGGGVETVDLVNPFRLGDCWSTWCGRFHDTAANGFENIGGRFGPAGSVELSDLTQPVEVDTEAHLLRLDLRADISLESFAVEAVANDVVFGVMGATLSK